MNMEGIVNLLVQIPLVGIFVWFVLKLDDRNKISQEKRDEQYLRTLAALSDGLSSIKTSFGEHDAYTRTCLSALEKKDS